MKIPLNILKLLLAFLLLASCSQEKETSTSSSNSGKSVQIDSTKIRDSLEALKIQLEEKLDSLKSNFTFAQEDFQGRSYYHKNWRRTGYHGQENMLIAGVDSIGNLFLISNLRGGFPDEKHIHNAIEIEFPDNKYYLISDTLLGEFKSHHMLICACRWEIASYSKENALIIGKKVSENMEETIRCTFYSDDFKIHRIRLSKKEKENIRDAYLLTKTIKKLNYVTERLGINNP